MEELRETRTSTASLSREDFDVLFNLGVAQPWLQTRTEAIHCLLAECRTAKQMKLVLDLLRRFQFLDGPRAERCLSEIATQIADRWALDPLETLLFATCRDQAPDGSQALLNAIKSPMAGKSGWTESRFRNSLSDFRNAARGISNVVLIDDFIGTGNTVEKKVSWIRKELAAIGESSKFVCVCALAGMEFSQKRLDLLGIKYFSANWLRKSLTEHFVGNELKVAYADMEALEGQLSETIGRRRLADHRLGYGASETIFAASGYDVPNNVLPIFWWERSSTGVRPPLFRRIL